jgi:hypothetical protein
MSAFDRLKREVNQKKRRQRKARASQQKIRKIFKFAVG